MEERFSRTTLEVAGVVLLIVLAVAVGLVMKF